MTKIITDKNSFQIKSNLLVYQKVNPFKDFLILILSNKCLHRVREIWYFYKLILQHMLHDKDSCLTDVRWEKLKIIDWMEFVSLTLTDPSVGNKQSSISSHSIWSDKINFLIKSNINKVFMLTHTPTFNNNNTQKP